jgi:hypothetical protein
MRTATRAALWLVGLLLCHLAVGVWERHAGLIYRLYWYPILGLIVVSLCIDLLVVMLYSSRGAVPNDAPINEILDVGRIEIDGPLLISDGFSALQPFALECKSGSYSILIESQRTATAVEISRVRVVKLGERVRERTRMKDFVVDSGSMVIGAPAIHGDRTAVREAEYFGGRCSASSAKLLQIDGITYGVRILPEFGDGSYAVYTLRHEGQIVGVECTFR